MGNRKSFLVCCVFGSTLTTYEGLFFMSSWTEAMKLLKQIIISYIVKINITNQPQPKGLSNQLLASFSPRSLIFPTPQGSNRTPHLILNLGQPCISVYHLPTVKTSVSLVCVSSLPGGVVKRFCGYCLVLWWCWFSLDASGNIHNTTEFSNSACHIQVCL